MGTKKQMPQSQLGAIAMLATIAMFGGLMVIVFIVGVFKAVFG